MTPQEYAAEAYKDYRGSRGLAWQVDEDDADKFIGSVVKQINAIISQVSGELDKAIEKGLVGQSLLSGSKQSNTLTQSSENGQQAGKVELAVGVQGDQVAIEFGTLIRNISMPPKQARQFAEMVRKVSYKAEGREKRK